MVAAEHRREHLFGDKGKSADGSAGEHWLRRVNFILDAANWKKLFDALNSASFQEVEHAPTVEQCGADHALMVSKFEKGIDKFDPISTGQLQRADQMAR